VGGDWVDWREDRRAGLKVWPVYCGKARISVGMLVQRCTVGAREWRIEGSVGCWDRVRRGGAGWITLKCASIGGTGTVDRGIGDTGRTGRGQEQEQEQSTGVAMEVRVFR
jgi:hypothetical protein